MGKYAILVHGGAGPDSPHIRDNYEEFIKGLKDALAAGKMILEKEGSAVDAVEAAIKSLEDNPLFNAGRGSALNSKAEIEMSASIMSGKERNCGATAIVKNVRNPITLAKAIMLNTNFVGLGGNGAIEYAMETDVKMEPDAYFITEHQYEIFLKKRKDEFDDTEKLAYREIKNRMHGTVGAVAVDKNGNVASGTSTGGTENQKQGRISDSCLLGAGTFACNRSAAFSCTGDGEYIIRGVISNTIANYMINKKCSLKEAMDYVVLEENKHVDGDIGVIGVTPDGDYHMVFNSDRMHRGYLEEGGDPVVSIYEE
jgi:L-asparaginase / beta-aspartyl-peptidase